MSLLADLDAASLPTNRSRPCLFNMWLQTVTPEEREAVRAAVGSIPDLRLAEAINKNAIGYKVSESTIATHRRNACVTCRS